MSWKKNGFSYIVWLVYTLMTGTALLGLTNGRTGETIAWLLSAAAILMAAGAVVFLLRRFAPRYSYDREEKHTVRNVAEAAVAVMLLAVGLALRVKGLEDAGQTAAYFEMAEVTSGQRIPQIAHGAVYFYVQILHTIFYFLGNKFIAGIWFQIILQLGAALLLYFSMRYLAGHIAALVLLAFLMCAPYMIQNALLLTPEMFYLFLFSAVLACVAAAHAARLRVLSFLFLGLAVALLSFMDVAGLLLFLPAVAGIFRDRRERPGEAGKAGAFVLCFLGFLIGFAGCVFADAAISGKSADGVFSAWLTLYHPEAIRLPLEISASGSAWEAFVLAGLMALGIFSFWCDQERDRMGAYTLGLCLVLAASVCGVFTEEMPGNLYVFLLAAVMAGICVEECFREKPAAAAVSEVSGQTVRKRRKSLSADADRADCAEAKEKLTCECRAEAKEVSEKGEARKKREAPETDSAAQLSGEPERKIKYIENPLPLPKKHEKRVMDYGLKVEKDKDDFDVDVADDDDFDI